MGDKRDVWKETPTRGFTTGDALQPRANEGAVRDLGGAVPERPWGPERDLRTERDPGGLRAGA